MISLSTDSGQPRRPLSLCAALLLAAIAVAPRAYAAPNIVLILVDDQGWNGTSVQMDPNVPGSKSDFYQTPNLEALAASGMRFSNGYSAAPSCAPTRAALFTGKSPAQLQQTDLKDAQPGTALYLGGYTGLPLTGPTPELFDPTQLTLPRLLKQVNPNYTTAIYGKWHLNLPTSTTPQASGFDFGVDPPLPLDSVDPWGVQNLSALSNDFMASAVAQGKPFFVQVSHKSPHPPVRSRSALRAKYEALPPGAVHHDPAYAAMVEDLDTSIGTVLQKIEDLGIEDNTYVFYVSDNGAPLAYSLNTPLKIGKASIWEGGIRVPFIVRGPGIQAGSTSEVSVMTTDLMTTFAGLAGYTGPAPEGVEGADFSSVLHNGGQLPAGVEHLDRQFSERGEIYFHMPHNYAAGPVFRIRPASAVRDGDFKLLVEYGEHGGPDQLYLHNLRTDVGETINLAASMPQKAAELKAMLDNYLAQVDASFAYDVKTPIQLAWNAGQPGNVANGWRSTIDVQYKGRETWTMGGAAERPTAVNAVAYQTGLSGKAFSFDGGDIMRRRFFHVADIGPRHNTPNVGTPEFNRSGSFDVWFRATNLTHNQVLFESGDGTKGISLTLGDADASGSFNDLRFRVLGANGESLIATVPIDQYANPVSDFIHATAVYNDDDNDRYVELYINGALASRIDGTAGSSHSLQWDGFDQAGLGRHAGAGIGGNGGGGALPFSGGFTGQFAAAGFWNTPLTGAQVASNYNAKLDPVWFGVGNVSGGALIPAARPTRVSLGVTESNSLQVFQERQHRLAGNLSVDAIVNGGGTMTAGNPFPSGSLPGGTDFISYLLHFDPVGSGATPKTAAGSIQFNHDIVAIVLNQNALAATDPILGAIGNYGAAGDRGVQLAGGDFITISADRRTLSFSLTVAGGDLVQMRVLTEPTLAADFNGDGVVNGADLTAWRSATGVSGFGDADGDGDSDGGDYLVWQRQLGMTSGSTAAAGGVPEPATWVLLLAAGVAAGARLWLTGSRARRAQ